MSNFHSYMETPVGWLKIEGNEQAISVVSFLDEVPDLTDSVENEVTELAKKQLVEYFARQRQTFDFPMSPQGTDFQKRVWVALQAIGFGSSLSYLDLSKKLGDVKAIRAVGRANGANPIAIVVPCHRIIGHNGDLTGYAGGLWRKKWLIDFESGQQSLF